ncbi:MULTISPECIES: GAF domain-containing protein [Herbidospora]|uniref:GAF domain-containing protein n=1 Tax=Herbidospora TaxID=28443 RepID=UPI000A63A7D8|nr:MULTISPECIES: GAF domain-containing protein [Herbidospora]
MSGPGVEFLLANVLQGVADLSGVDGAALRLLDDSDRLRMIGATDEDGWVLERAGCSALSVPLVEGREVIGELTLYTHERHEWSRSEVEKGARLGELVVVALEAMAGGRTESSASGQVR